MYAKPANRSSDTCVDAAAPAPAVPAPVPAPEALVLKPAVPEARASGESSTTGASVNSSAKLLTSAMLATDGTMGGTTSRASTLFQSMR